MDDTCPNREIDFDAIPETIPRRARSSQMTNDGSVSDRIAGNARVLRTMKARTLEEVAQAWLIVQAGGVWIKSCILKRLRNRRNQIRASVAKKILASHKVCGIFQEQ